jgi:uncharacterized repeat protein (TIGR01451 family)
MKSKSSLFLNLIIVLCTALAIWSAGAQARVGGIETGATTTQPVHSSLPEPTLQEKDGTPEQETWDALPPEVRAKVDPRILAELRGEVVPSHLSSDPEQAQVAPWKQKREPLDQTRFLVYLKASADLKTIARQPFASRMERRAAVFDALVSTAQATQGPVKALLNAEMSQGDVQSYQPFYVVNGFAVEGGLKTIIELAQRDDVERIVANYPLVLLSDNGQAAVAPARDLHPDNWNIDLVDAERVWQEFGISGEGAVVGGFDTGVDYDHPALANQYRGYLGPGTLDHNYNWFEADSNLYPNGDLGRSVSNVPYDCDEHGTHTMGTMVGDGGTSGTQVGMAPGARWIAAPGICGNTMPGGLGDDIGGIKTFQWFLCPTDLSGDLATADCSKAPDVVNNSWGSSNPADDTFRPIIQALRAAGIAPVFASGNPSAGPGSIGAPGNVPEAITVGATDGDDVIASFSGRGPSFYAGEQKPELAAPGVDINSTLPGDGYSGPYWSGTSMAAPHVAGLVALLVSADLQDGIRDFNVDELERFMEYTAVDLGPPGPDNDYGYGRIDAYDAVRWARSAGDLQGAVTAANTGTPIIGAAVTGLMAGSGDTFATTTNAGGQYSTTVPAGTYNVTVEAWGYHSDTFPGQMVIPGALSIKDFALTALPTTPLTGQVASGGTPVAGALVYVKDAPWVSDTTGPTGAYGLMLPPGTHEIVVQATSYRILHVRLDVAAGGSSHDFDLTPAPTILLVEADASAGWFFGRPVRNFFRWALDQEGYLYDMWVIQYTDFNDTRVMPDGITGYGVPSNATLGSYDLVIWAHTGGSPSQISADDELMAYLSQGGRLIISGQDIGYHDSGTVFFNDYLHADYTIDLAANEGETVSGTGFLTGINLEITSAALYNYRNTALGLYPDAVAAADGAAYPVLTYDNDSGAAALAIAPCDASYRAVYLALGYENIGPRADNRDPAIAELLDRSIEWAMSTKSAYDFSVTASTLRQMGAPGATATNYLQVTNTGNLIDTFVVSTAGNRWPTRILDDQGEPVTSIEVAPCASQGLILEVAIPPTAMIGDQDAVTIKVAGRSNKSVTVTTVAFPLWQTKVPMPTRRYRLAAANLPQDIYYYAIGGQDYGTGLNANERYNACTGQWESMAPMPTARANTGAAVINDKIYVPGGYDGVASYLQVLEIYDPATDSWSFGAAMPQALSGLAVAAYNGRLYTFGGVDSNGFVDDTYEYDPASDTWTTRTPLPGDARAFAAAAELDGKIYVAGGWPNLRTVEIYDPATDSWSTAAPLHVGRQAAGLVGAPDGYLYVSGGGDEWVGLGSAERYDPATDTWEIIPELNDSSRAGSASAFAGGQLFAIGGVDPDLSNVNESLLLTDAFCFSNKSAWQQNVRPGERITYTVEIHPDENDLTNARVIDPIPTDTTFAGFGVNPIGASYNANQERVEWSGAVPAGSDPLTFTFGIDLDPTGWAVGDRVRNEAVFDSGTGILFTQTADTVVSFPDPSPSTKSADRDLALAGEVLNFTVQVINASASSGLFTLRDPLPAATTYVPGSLAFSSGSGSYNSAENRIEWSGTLPQATYINTSSDYQWGDSDGSGVVPGVMFSWEDATAGSVAIDFYLDDWYAGPFDIGFSFSYYDNDYTQFYINSNGSVQFGDGSSWYDGCPIDSEAPNNAIHLLGGDRVVDGSPGKIYYQTFGAAPNRYTVIEFYQLRDFLGSTYSNLEIILYESGTIKLQYEDMEASMMSGTIGIDDSNGTSAMEYQNACPATVHDNLAILFLPPGGVMGTFSADVTYAARSAASLPINSWITNTATIATPFNTVERSASVLINPVDLGASVKRVDKAQAAVNEVVTYDLILKNTGLLTAEGASLNDTIPQYTAYADGSLTCSSGSCDYSAGVITWNGDIPPGGAVTVSFAVTLITTLQDLTPVTNHATLDNGYGDLYDLAATFIARSSDLSASFKTADRSRVEPGDTVTYTVHVHNSSAVATTGELRDELPPELTYVANSLTCGTGTCSAGSGVINWNGSIPARALVPVRFQAQVSSAAKDGDRITNTAVITDHAWMTGYPVAATILVRPGPEPDWQKQIWISTEGPYTPGDTLPRITLTDTIQIADWVNVSHTGEITFSLVEEWSASLALIDVENLGGSYGQGTGRTMSWQVVEGMPGTWYALTKTFQVVNGNWTMDAITETLWVENTIPQPRPIYLEFRHAGEYELLLPLVIKHY